jgi:hypothetical protein
VIDPWTSLARLAATKEVGALAWFRRRSVASSPARVEAADNAHLDQFVRSRRGVEAYVEPRTSVTEMTVLLVAHDGEWTRRRISGPQEARRLGERLSIPVYDVAATGYPQRFRDWTRDRKRVAGPDAPTTSPQLD